MGNFYKEFKRYVKKKAL